MSSGNGLSEGWAQVTLADICKVNPRKPSADALLPGTPVTFVPMPAVDANAGAITGAREKAFAQARKGSYTPFQDGDVLFAKITPCMENGKAAIARNLTNGIGFGSTEFHVFRPSAAILPDYVYYFIRQESFREQAKNRMSGNVGQQRVPVGFVKQAEIPLSPLPEQERIVAKVEELLGWVSAARQRLSQVPTILKRFRQAVLANACSGKLTEDWREEHQCDVEPSSVLLKKLIKANPQDKECAVLENECLAEVPFSWTWASVAQLGTVITGNTPSKKVSEYFGGPIPFFKPTDLDAGYYVKAANETLSKKGGEVARVLPALSVMVTCIGATIGKTGLSRVKGATNQQINSVVSERRMISPHWLYIAFASPWGQEQIRSRASETTLPILNKGRFCRIPLALPPFVEQHEIVRRVEALFALADGIERRVAAATRQAEKLTQSILAKAFRGELVPTEAELARREGRDYETAEQLLTRIRAEREKKSDTPRKSKGKRGPVKRQRG